MNRSAHMKYGAASLMVASLALAAGPHGGVSASPVRHPVADVDILVDGAPQRRYPHGGRWYVEALEGREYAIRLRNPYAVRVAVSLSVDGLNAIDARHTTSADARKWVLAPYGTVIISGWQTNQRSARRFAFTSEARSYGQALGQTSNLGVITAVFFKERVAAIVRDTSNDRARHRSPAPRSSPAPAAEVPAIASRGTKADEEYAATGMGRPTSQLRGQILFLARLCPLDDSPRLSCFLDRRARNKI